MDDVKKLITVAILVLLVAGLGVVPVVPAEAVHTGLRAGSVDDGHIKSFSSGFTRSPQWLDCRKKCEDAFWQCTHEQGYYSSECNVQVGACRKKCPA
ncbi:MAG TPA: hypothetical protein VMC84_06505 [Methanocella sp.]|uniref:hypothetical protein n=1 Tax=Methanocella sp. TaxID=2052833 RepID=UPI002B722082|nr:hypothetical protein [Methanocella sp.]HTY90812.1 hypothetical protein [Methanocella sp.]